MIVDRRTRRELLNAIEQLAAARGWLSLSAPVDRESPTAYITQAIAHIDAALNDEGGGEG